MITAALLGLLLVTWAPVGGAAANGPALSPNLTASNGASECWSRGATLWHFVVFNNGTAGGKYTVTYIREEGDEAESYTRFVPKKQGLNDGLVIPAGTTVAYVRVSSATQGTLFLRYNVPPKARCSS